MAQLQADYIYRKGDHEKDTLDNINLAYDPATGVNYPYAASGPGRALLPYPQYGTMSMIPHNTRSRYEAIQTAFTKRMSQRWQASATYTLSWLWDAENQPFSGLNIVPFKVAPDLGNNFTYGQDDQRHRFVFNGIWEVAHGLQVSGIHYFGAGHPGEHELRRRSATGWQRRLHAAAAERNDRRAQQLHPAGSEQDRHPPAAAHPAGRPELRRPDRGGVQRVQHGELPLVTQESAANYNQPNTGQNRTAQLGFRVAFYAVGIRYQVSGMVQGSA